ncbi:MAG: RelA/SpoT family protein [Bacteroidales bacterium]
MYSSQEQEQIQKSFDELLVSMKTFATTADLQKVRHAFSQVMMLYENQTMESGKPYVLHLIDIAKIVVSEVGMRTSTVISALMHGINLKTQLQPEWIRKEYGESVIRIISGFIKVSELPTERISFQSDTFRRMFLTMIDDIRVILLKVAHRLYDLRNPGDYPPEKFEVFVHEVKHLYIPIVHRLGLYKIKAEFEESVMKYENPEIYKSISDKIKASKDRQEAFMKDFIKPIENDLVQHGLKCSIKWRTKSIPSIYTKMRTQNVEFEQVYDLFAIRIITSSTPKKEKEDCWRAYSVVTDLYAPNPKRLRDWITSPKASGYESLHTTVKAKDEKWVEVQIRSERMDEVAEKGQAAHWQYKGVSGKRDTDDLFNQIRDILEDPEQINFNVGNAQMGQNVSDKIFIFTPNGDLKQLPHGSTVLDFAYEVHTRVGDTCNGARVNNRIVPIRHLLQNGDKVEVITSKKQTPKHDWLSFVNTERARSKIKRYLKEQESKEADFGKAVLNRKLKNWKINLTDENINLLVKHYKTPNAIEFYHMIATEKIDMVELKKFLISISDDDKSQQRPARMDETIEIKNYTPSTSDDFLVIEEGIANVNYKLSKCCSPIPGDSVFGFVTISTGITIHRVNCPNAKRLRERYNYRLLNVKWKESKDSSMFQTAIKLSGRDVMGLVGDITKVISGDLKVNMRSISFDSKDGLFDGKIVLQIKDTEHLDQLISKLGRVPGVEKVNRID